MEVEKLSDEELIDKYLQVEEFIKYLEKEINNVKKDEN